MSDHNHPKTLTRSTKARLLAAASLLSVVLIAGCGGSSGTPPVANVASSTTSTSSAASAGAATTSGSSSATTSSSSSAAGNGAADSGPSSPAALDSQALAYARCMRANGVPKFPDPQAGGGFQFQKGGGVDPSSPLFEAAQAKCQKLMPMGGLTPGAQTHPSPQALTQMVHVAQCMRRRGISNFPDPRTSIPSNPRAAVGGTGVISNIDGVVLVFPGTIDEQSPAFTRAAAACNFPLHNH